MVSNLNEVLYYFHAQRTCRVIIMPRLKLSQVQNCFFLNFKTLILDFWHLETETKLTDGCKRISSSSLFEWYQSIRTAKVILGMWKMNLHGPKLPIITFLNLYPDFFRKISIQSKISLGVKLCSLRASTT